MGKWKSWIGAVLMALGLFSIGWAQDSDVQKDLSSGEKMTLSIGSTKCQFKNDDSAATVSLEGKASEDLSPRPFLKVDDMGKKWVFTLSKGRVNPNFWDKMDESYQIQIQTPLGIFKSTKTHKGESTLLIVKVEKGEVTVFLGRGKVTYQNDDGNFELEKSGGKTSLWAKGVTSKGKKKTDKTDTDTDTDKTDTDKTDTEKTGSEAKETKNLSVGEEVTYDFTEVKVSIKYEGSTVVVRLTGSPMTLPAELAFLKVDDANKRWAFAFKKGRLAPEFWEKMPKGYQFLIRTYLGIFQGEKTYMDEPTLLIARADKKEEVLLFLGHGKIEFTCGRGGFVLAKTGEKVMVSLRGAAKAPVEVAKGNGKKEPTKTVKGNGKKEPGKINVDEEYVRQLKERIKELEKKLAAKKEKEKKKKEDEEADEDYLDFLLDSTSPLNSNGGNAHNKFKGQK